MRGSPFDALGKKLHDAPEVRRQLRLVSWYLVGGSGLVLIIALVDREHPNPYLIPGLLVIAVDGVLFGLGFLLYLRQSRLAGWLILLGFLLLILFFCFFVQMVSYS